MVISLQRELDFSIQAFKLMGGGSSGGGRVDGDGGVRLGRGWGGKCKIGGGRMRFRGFSLTSTKTS